LGLGKIWIGTASGLTRTYGDGGFIPHWDEKNTETIKSLYYKRAVDGLDNKYKYVFTGAIPSSRKESAANLTITMSTALIFGGGSRGGPMGVVAFNMRYSAFNDHLARYTFNCRDPQCYLTCNDTQHVLCYIVDDNGYILANNNPDYNGTGSFLGSQNPRLMTELVRDKIYKGLKLTDYQGICYIRAKTSQESASSYTQNPLRLMSRLIFWVFSELAMLISEWNIFSHFTFGTVWGQMEARDEEECGEWIEESEAKYFYCNFVVNETTGKKVFVQKVLDFSSCITSLMRYTLNKHALIRQQKRSFLPGCAEQCAEGGSNSFKGCKLRDATHSLWTQNLNRKKKILLPSFLDLTSHNEATQCQTSLNFANELKEVDSTRTPNNRTLCLDATSEVGKILSSAWSWSISVV
ncbi:voltage-dependent calcium channel subunit alpha-2/delta-3-like protein, partial [Elysia marginata]